MKPIFKTITISSLCLIFLSIKLSAQLPVCSGSSLLYFCSNGAIYNFDPTQPVSVSNPSANTIPALSGAIGLAVSDNLDAPSPSPTFYMVKSGNYYYYNGSAWVNTGHNTGNVNAVNPGAGGGYIYNLVGNTGQVYAYNGTGNGTLLTTISGFSSGGPYDLAADCSGNFYLLKATTPQWLNEYNSAGTLLNTWTLSGLSSTGAGNGLAIIGDSVYVQNGSGYYIGVMSGSSVSFSLITSAGLSPVPDDFASCPFSTGTFTSGTDSVHFCYGSIPESVHPQGAAPYIWTVLNGPASLTAMGDSALISSTANAAIVAVTSSTSCISGIVSDTFQIIVDSAQGPSVAITSNYPGPGQAATFTAGVTNGGTNVSYQWYLNNYPLPGAINEFYNTSLSSFDSLCVRVHGGVACAIATNAEACAHATPLQSSMINTPGNFKVYPNPSNGTFTLSGDMGAESATIEIDNTLGQSVYKDVVSSLNGIINNRISLPDNLGSGFYFLHIITETENKAIAVNVSK